MAAQRSGRPPARQRDRKAKQSAMNDAFLFIKPHACNPQVVALIKGMLDDASIKVVDEGAINAEQIDEGGLIDAHYGTLAERAMSVAALELPVWTAGIAAEFEATFGVSHTAAAADGKLLNLKEALALLPHLDALGACPKGGPAAALS